ISALSTVFCFVNGTFRRGYGVLTAGAGFVSAAGAKPSDKTKSTREPVRRRFSFHVALIK
ncbi:MAG: hypothetical protein LIO55_07760, partial [Oscillospiraceae bacterium]|nr:hypothetical protein [Oscillospiraceae bacterium]